MDFTLTDEQRLLADSVNRLVADAYGDWEKRKTYSGNPRGYSPQTWQAMADLGLLALPLPADLGGFDGTPVETAIVAEAFGRGLVLEPFLPTVILGLGLLRRTNADPELLTEVASGTTTLAFAHQERQARHDLHDIATTAIRDGDAYVLNGAKGIVLHGDSADRLIVSARTSDARRDRHGISLFLLDPATPGVTRRGYPTQDGTRAAEVILDNARATTLLGEPDTALPLIELVTDEAIAALCAEAVGAMETLRDLTVDYLKQRQQFGGPLAGFQALQHRAADMLVATEQARSMVYYAAMMVAHPDAAARRTALSAAKALVGRLADGLGKDAIQLHGGIGVTDEYKAGHYFKRLTIIAGLFGDVDHHLRQVVAAGGLPDVA